MINGNTGNTNLGCAYYLQSLSYYPSIQVLWLMCLTNAVRQMIYARKSL